MYSPFCSTHATIIHKPPTLIMHPAMFTIKSAYGLTRAYPANETARLLCSLTGTTTLLPQNIGIIEDLGFQCINELNDTVIVPSLLY